MKKKILSGIFVLALLTTTGLGVRKSMKSDAKLSNLALSNVEALAQGENSVSIPCEKSTGDTCNFSCTLADGTQGTCSMTNMKKV